MKQVIDNIFYHNYIKKLKNEKRIVRIWQIIILVLFFAIWEVTSKYHIIDPLLFSSPSKIFLQIYHKMLDGTMMIHLQVTVFETVLGFILGTFIGVRSEEHTSELQSRGHLVCRLLLEKKNI